MFIGSNGVQFMAEMNELQTSVSKVALFDGERTEQTIRRSSLPNNCSIR